MAGRLDRLTAEQEAMLPVVRDEFLRLGLTSGPTDRVTCEEAVRLAYRCAGLEEPGIVIWLASPLAGAIGAVMLANLPVPTEVWDQVLAQVRDQVLAQVGAQVRAQVWDQVGDQVRDQVWDQVWDQVRAQVWDQVRAQVWDQVRAQVWGQVGDQVWDQVRAQVWDQVGDQVWDQVRAQVWDQVRAQVYRAGYGSHDAGWLAFYEVMCRLGIDVSRLSGLLALTRCGWWWPFKGAVILTELPTELHRDERGRLHRTDGAAIQYSDGWGVYAVHGTRIPEWVVREPERLTPVAISSERNTEIRRAMIEVLGWDKYLSEAQAVVVHADEYGTLLRLDLPDDEPIVAVRVLNSTPEPDGSTKYYLLRVHPELRPLLADGQFGEPQRMTAINAVASTFGMRGEEYAPVVET